MAHSVAAADAASVDADVAALWLRFVVVVVVLVLLLPLVAAFPKANGFLITASTCCALCIHTYR